MKNNNETLICNIKNAGIVCYSRVVARFDYCVTRWESASQSATFHTINVRYNKKSLCDSVSKLDSILIINKRILREKHFFVYHLKNMKYIFITILITITTINTIAQKVLKDTISHTDTSIVSSRVNIGNDTCRLYIQQIKSDSLYANIWLIRNKQISWETTIFKSRLEKYFNYYIEYSTDSTINSIKFDDLVLTGIEYYGIRANRLFYYIYFFDKQTKRKYLFNTGIMYLDEKELKKE